MRNMRRVAAVTQAGGATASRGTVPREPVMLYETERRAGLAGTRTGAGKAAQDREAGRLVPILGRSTQDIRQPIHAVYYRNTAISSRIASFVDYLTRRPIR